jgi:hypothetical protein
MIKAYLYFIEPVLHFISNVICFIQTGIWKGPADDITMTFKGDKDESS